MRKGSKALDLIEEISYIVRSLELPFVIFGHPRIMYDRSDPDQAKRLQKAV